MYRQKNTLKTSKTRKKTALASEFIDYYLRIRQQLIVPI